MTWSFLVDENLSPTIARILQSRGYPAEHVTTALHQGADDVREVLPYARQHDHVIVTNDVKDFRDLPPTQHEGILLLQEDQYQSHDVAFAIETVVEAYPSRQQLFVDYLDDYL